MRPELPTAQRGFGLVAVLFLIIVIAGVIAAMARLAVNQHSTSSLALQQARAYQAARAGLEWGIHRAVHGAGCHATQPFVLGGLSGFEVAVTCVSTVPQHLQEEGRPVRFRTLAATAISSQAGSPGHVYRHLSATLEE